MPGGQGVQGTPTTTHPRPCPTTCMHSPRNLSSSYFILTFVSFGGPVLSICMYDTVFEFWLLWLWRTRNVPAAQPESLSAATASSMSPWYQCCSSIGVAPSGTPMAGGWTSVPHPGLQTKYVSPSTEPACSSADGRSSSTPTRSSRSSVCRAGPMNLTTPYVQESWHRLTQEKPSPSHPCGQAKLETQVMMSWQCGTHLALVSRHSDTRAESKLDRWSYRL